MILSSKAILNTHCWQYLSDLGCVTPSSQLVNVLWLVFTQLAKSAGMVIHLPQAWRVKRTTLSIYSEINNRER